ncbi:hypothetical protein ACV1DG_23575 [Aeromonas hydrophila]|uniref:hypothetical protein n=1 Tax=Aeromonas caviae TaxID=648 RepID=UPI001CC566D9|nr:hypothetical protein [Aeromonas caviae]GJA78133.1 hypothetical protein KAM354_33690 [Aeromonas caviae]HDT5888754.1 hypothetical protein [Aeromonas dhakensis]HEB4980779.1 hypothetical protein [Aeromonas dhakensis]HEB5079408.1 hypothetical protein [Aeromonas hydrophila subsp. hydrophila]
MAEMTQEEFMQLQGELEHLELTIAKGEETDNTDSRLKELECLMEDAPWVLIPGEGCLPRDAGGVNRAYGDQASVDLAAIEDEL